MRENSAWSVPLRIEDIPEEGCRREISADDAVRAALAREAGVLGITCLSAAFDLARRPEGGVHVGGSVSATVRQTCSISLEPMENEVAESFALTFMPASSESADPAGDHSIPPEEADEPETLVGGRIDLGAIATEFLILGIDPYPRKEGAVLAVPVSATDRTSPFDVLASLKKR